MWSVMRRGRAGWPHKPPPDPDDPAQTLRALDHGVAWLLAARTWPVAAVACACAALAGAALGTHTPAPGDTPLAVVGPGAALAAAPALVLAVLVAWRRGEAAARGREGEIPHLRVRGAAWRQIARLVAGEVVPAFLVCALTAIAAGLGAAVAATALVAAFHNRFSPAVPAQSLGWSLAAGLTMGVAAGAGFAAALLGTPPQARRSPAPRNTWSARLWADVALLLCGLWIARTAAAYVGASALGAPQGLLAVAFAGMPTTGAPPAAPAYPLAAMAVGAALAVLGCALLGGRLLAALLALIERRNGASATAVSVLLLRAVGRGAAPLRLLLLPALAAAAVAFTVGGALGVRATDRAYDALSVGAPVEVVEQWPSGCHPECTPASTQVPPLDVLNTTLRGAAATSTIVHWPATLETISGAVPVDLAGLDPGAFGRVAEWGFMVGAPVALKALAANPDAAIVSTELAARANLSPGDGFQVGDLPFMTVVAVEPGWPGLGLGAGQDWAVVPWPTLQDAITKSGAYAHRSLTADLLARMQEPTPLAALTPAVSDLSSRLGPSITAIRVPGGRGTGLGWLPAILLPELAGLLLLTLWAAGAPTLDPSALPSGEVLAALAAGPEVDRARRRLRAILTWSGLGWGAAAGTSLAPPFWAALRIGPHTTLAVPFLGVWWGLAAAAILLATGGVLLVRTVRSEPRDVADGFVAARVAAVGRPEAELPSAPAGGSPPWRRLPALLWALIRSVGATLLVAARRLRASWTVLPWLAAGMLLASAVAAALPLFTAGSMTRVLQAGLQSQDNRPAGAVLVSLYPRAGTTVGQAEIDRLGATAARAGTAAGTTQSTPVRFLATRQVEAVPEAGGRTDTPPPYVQIDALPGLAAHAVFDRGGPPPAQTEADGVIDAAVTDRAAAFLGVGYGQVYVLRGAGGSPVRLRVTGLFSEAAGDGTYWPYLYPDHDLFVDPGVWNRLVLTEQRLPVGEVTFYTVLHVRDLTALQVPAAMAGLRRFGAKAGDAGPGAGVPISPVGELQAFLVREQTVAGLVRLGSVPILGLALYFVFMTAGLAVRAQSGEIAILRSRGASRVRVAAIHLAEWVLLAVPLAALAPFPAILLARALGAADGFLHFVPRPPLQVFLQPLDFLYSGAAAALALAAALAALLPAMERSVVQEREHQSRTVDTPLWQRAYLDVLALALLAVGGWALRGAGGHSTGAAALVDHPSLFLLPTVTVLAAGLLVVRLLGWVMRVAEYHFGRWWTFSTSFPVRRIGRLPARFAPTLLLLALAAGLGVYSAASARTFDRNLAATVQYQVGAQVRIEQVSPCSLTQIPPPVCDQYGLTGPTPRSLPPFRVVAAAAGVRAATPLIEMPVTVGREGGGTVAATLVLVDPATFAAAAWWRPDLDARTEAQYLRLLRSAPDAALVSPGLVKPHAASLAAQLADGPQATLRVMGTVTRWPGADVTGPMVVAPLAAGTGVLGMTCAPAGYPGGLPSPCAGTRIALLDLQPGASVAGIEQTLMGEGLASGRTDDAAAMEAAAQATPEWAGQTGALTIGFLVALAVAAVGYLLQIRILLRGQTGQLGLLRALGVGQSSLAGAVLKEQGLVVLTGAAGGAVAGLLIARWFLPLFAPAFTGVNAPPFSVAGPGQALWQVAAVLGIVFGVALLLLALLLRGLQVAETVKIED